MGKPSLLIVDDEPGMLISLSTLLEDEFHVKTASNGREALSIIKNKSLSLILSDLHMPEMTGVELLEQVRESDSTTPILIMTGNSCQDWAERCADLNVQGYIKKPVNVDSLIERIKKLLCIDDCEVLREIWNGDYRKRMDQLSPVIKKSLRYMCDNCRKEFNRGKIAAFLEVSPDYLTRQFHKECGLNLSDYINKLRVHKSKELLQDSSLKIKEIAAAAGIRDVSYFCSVFKEQTGMTPKEYQKKILVTSKHASVEDRSV